MPFTIRPYRRLPGSGGMTEAEKEMLKRLSIFDRERLGKG